MFVFFSKSMSVLSYRFLSQHEAKWSASVKW